MPDAPAPACPGCSQRPKANHDARGPAPSGHSRAIEPHGDNAPAHSAQLHVVPVDVWCSGPRQPTYSYSHGMRPLCGWARRVTCPRDPGAHIHTGLASGAGPGPPTTTTDGGGSIATHRSSWMDMGLLAARCPTSQSPAGTWASLIRHSLRRIPRDRKAPRGRARKKQREVGREYRLEARGRGWQAVGASHLTHAPARPPVGLARCVPGRDERPGGARHIIISHDARERAVSPCCCLHASAVFWPRRFSEIPGTLRP